jgi:preprotein translocase subunit SecE
MTKKMADNKDTSTATATTMGLAKYVHVMYFVGTVVVGWLFVKITETVWTALNLTFTAVPPPSNLVEVVMGGGGALALGIYLWRHPKVNSLVVEIVVELSKVSWPTRKELSASTVVVIVLSIIASIILGLFDFFWSWCTDFIYHSG